MEGIQIVVDEHTMGKLVAQYVVNQLKLDDPQSIKVTFSFEYSGPEPSFSASVKIVP